MAGGTPTTPALSGSVGGTFDPAFMSGAGGAIPNLPTPNMTPTTYTSGLGGNIGKASTTYDGSGSSNNVYNSGSLQLQGLLPGMLSSILQGQSQIPNYFTAPQQVFDAANHNFDQYVAPTIAAQFGAGSPQMGSQKTQMNEDLAANLYQSGMSNFGNMLNSAAGLAMAPTGVTNTSNSTGGQTTMDATGSTSISGMDGTLLNLLRKNMGGP